MNESYTRMHECAIEARREDCVFWRRMVDGAIVPRRSLLGLLRFNVRPIEGRNGPWRNILNNERVFTVFEGDWSPIPPFFLGSGASCVTPGVWWNEQRLTEQAKARWLELEKASGKPANKALLYAFTLSEENVSYLIILFVII